MIFIVGAPRSGTSLTSRIIQSQGGYFGDHNSLMEGMALKKHLKRTLKTQGFDPMGQSPIPHKCIEMPNVVDTFALYEIVKECKLVFFYEQLHKRFPDAQWVLVRRDYNSIIDSCERAQFMSSPFTYLDTYLSYLDEIENTCNTMNVYPKDFKEDNTGNMKEMIEWLDLEWDEAKARSVIHRSLLR